MKSYLLVVAFFLFINYTSAQQKMSKPPIDTSAIRTWPSLGGGQISNNGKYVVYTIENIYLGKKTLVLQSSDSKWKMEFPTASKSIISEDDKYVIFKKEKDSLVIVTLGTSFIETIANVKNFKYLQDNASSWIIYQSTKNDLVLRDVKNGKTKVFNSVLDYEINDVSKVLIIKSAMDNTNATQKLTWVHDFDGKATVIWEGNDINNIIFDEKGEQLVFTATPTLVTTTEKIIYYFKNGGKRAIPLISNQVVMNKEHLSISSISRFSNDASRLYLLLKAQPLEHADKNAVKVNIWSYSDSRLQSVQLKDLSSKDYYAIYNINDKSLIRIQNENESLEHTNDANFDIIYAWSQQSDFNERHWNSSTLRDVYLVSNKDGSRKSLSKGTLREYYSSPKGKYLVFFDSAVRQYFSYAIADGEITNLTYKIKDDWVVENPRPNMLNRSWDVCGWSEDDNSILLFNHNDIWKVDLRGTHDPINYTNGYGKKNNIQFFPLNIEQNVKNKGDVILIGYDRNTKDNGFYKINLNNPASPVALSTGPYAYYLPKIRYDVHGFRPIKAKHRNIYLIQRMTATEAPNFFTTSDFKKFRQLTNLFPEKKYNWLTTELHKWADDFGNAHTGVLFKPENFDSTKKYPLIFYYYEALSDLKNIYIKPEESYGTLNISWFVSHGYLVFTPDMSYKFGEPGKSALTIVTSATRYLSQLTYVDTKKLGLQGMSFGGFQTNYIVTHSNLFVAVCSSAGPTDLISFQGSVNPEGSSNQGFVEEEQLRIGSTLWENPTSYIDNSPIFNIHKVNTPILLMATTVDDAVPFSQSLEFFSSLRRLGKTAWLLEYEDGNHGVLGKSSTDFTIRMQQFFDFYLKDKQAPIWMLDGVPARLKGIQTGLELDTTGRKPGSSLLLTEEKTKIDSLSKRKSVIVTID